MPRLKHKLNDPQLKSWVKEGKPLAKSDGDGLTFTLSDARTASWILRYRWNGKRKELTIGNYPDIGLADARRIASAERAKIDGGAHPAEEKQKKKRTAKTEWTVKELVEDYKRKNFDTGVLSGNTIKNRNYDFDNVVIPKLGRKTVNSVTGKDIVQMLLEANKGWRTSNRVLTATTQVFHHAAGLRLIDNNPCVGVKLTAVLGPAPPVKSRVMLSANDLRDLLATMDTLGRANALALRIMLSTGVRTNELVQARWENVHLDEQYWAVPNSNTKTRKGFIVPLTAIATKWFEELKALAGDSCFVLPARIEKKAGKTIDPRTLWAAIDRAFKAGRLTITKFTPHDTRSTIKSHLKNLGVSTDDSEAVLSHGSGGIEATYDVRNEKSEVRAALEKWDEFLDTLRIEKLPANTPEKTENEPEMCS